MKEIETGARVRVSDYATQQAGRIGFVCGYVRDKILLQEHRDSGDRFEVPIREVRRDCGAFFCGHPSHRCPTEVG